MKGMHHRWHHGRFQMAGADRFSEPLEWIVEFTKESGRTVRVGVSSHTELTLVLDRLNRFETKNARILDAPKSL